MVSSESTVVEHLPHHPKVNGLSQAVAAGTGKEERGRRATLTSLMVSSESALVEHLPNHPKLPLNKGGSDCREKPTI